MSSCNQSTGAELDEEYDENDPPTVTTIEQARVEASVKQLFQACDRLPSRPGLLKDRHLEYLKNGLNHLNVHFECLDASRPWLIYWMLHSLDLLDSPVDHMMSSRVVQFLSRCQHEDGGFAGGPGQLSHLAPTYSAILSLAVLGTQEAYDCIDRPALQRFLIRLHQSDGSFIMHDDGEVDVRGAYLAAVAASLSNISVPIMFEKTAEWVASCQTYEGGFAAVPGTEAHGGYTFCGFAALVLLGKPHLCDMNKLMKWVTQRQMSCEGGFQGRSNKLVDGCYSFWQGGLFPLLQPILQQHGDPGMCDQDVWLFNRDALVKYILCCCQNPMGGLVDKPGRSRDFYHTCYCLSGLSICQHCQGGHSISIGHDYDGDAITLKPTHPVYNIWTERAEDTMEYFSKLAQPTIVSTAEDH
ncbi:protein farnesyltransferase subunit beta-like [Dysidea avara]|uniref:protein farnesyltransferase subunit beta-like n=1 Tax=Dysidea avara TaxID=196820 RepID=UPI0033312368